MKLLFVINTLGQGGAEKALLTFFRVQELAGCQIDLRVMLEQGELVRDLPGNVRLLNRRYSPESVLTRKGRKMLRKTVLMDFLCRGSFLRNLPYITCRFLEMRKAGKIRKDKLLWKIISDAAPRTEETYDLAVAWIEGASTYYVADHVKARRKAAFIHVDYGMAGYTPALDHGCYEKIDQIFCVSDEVRRSFLKMYPQFQAKTELFRNWIDVQDIRRKAAEAEGFADGFQGVRILTVCRLVSQKRLDVSVEAMRLLKERAEKDWQKKPLGTPLDTAGRNGIRWYVLGEGEDRKNLEKQIQEAGLTDDFLLAGVRKNPYPYFREADLYVHCTGFEGRSLAVEEAQILGKPVIVSDTSGNREQVEDGVDGLVVPLKAEAIADAVERLLVSPGFAEKLGKKAEKKDFRGGDPARLLQPDSIG